MTNEFPPEDTPSDRATTWVGVVVQSVIACAYLVIAMGLAGMVAASVFKAVPLAYPIALAMFLVPGIWIAKRYGLFDVDWYEYGILMFVIVSFAGASRLLPDNELLRDYWAPISVIASIGLVKAWRAVVRKR